jgi:hypothetical protein
VMAATGVPRTSPFIRFLCIYSVFHPATIPSKSN